MNDLRGKIKDILGKKGFSVAADGSISFNDQVLNPNELASFSVVITQIEKGLGINIENHFFEIAKSINGSPLEKIAQIVEMGRST